MKKYVILTRGIQDISGNPRYVNNKCKCLREQGWDVVVLWSYDTSFVKLDHIRCFDNPYFIFHELNYFPCWFNSKQRGGVLNRMAKVIGEADTVVIESNKLVLGAWGELLAEKLKAKHINFVTSEGVVIKNKASFDFYYEKLKRNEFFAINKAAINKMFSAYPLDRNIDNYYWSASPGTQVEDIPFPAFEQLPKADFTITSFGRTKGYFPKMISEIKSFAESHKKSSINIFFLGDIDGFETIEKQLAGDNVHVSYHPAVNIIPEVVFKKSNIVIATAGCASISRRYNNHTISMDVTRHEPLGILGYTTWDSNTYSGKYPSEKSLHDWLEDILVEKTEYLPLQEIIVPHRFDYQMQFVTEPDGIYLPVDNVCEKITSKDRFLIFLTKIGLYRLVDLLFFSYAKGKSKPQTRKPVIVEFNGLPGGGKTTIAKELMVQLYNDHYEVVGKYSHSIFHSSRPIFAIPFSFSLYNMIKKYGKLINPLRKNRTHLAITNAFARKYQTVDKYCDADYAIFDEGIIQFMVAMGGDDKFSHIDKLEDIVRKIKDLNVNFVRIDCNNTISETAERIQSRIQKGRFFERMSAEDLNKHLQVESYNFEALRAAFSKVYKNQPVIEINTNNSPQDNASLIKDYLLKLQAN